MRRPAAYLVLFVGLVCVSTSGPFLVMAGMDAYAVVLLRMALSAVVLLAWAIARRELRVAPGQGRAVVVGSLLLALHFILWVKAFDLTDYASNLLLLVAQPVTAALIGAALGERHGREIWLSLGLALAGLAVIAGGDFALGPRALLGDLMCIVAGLAIAAFYVVTTRARAGMPLPTFLGLTFAIGALATAPLVALAGVAVLDYPPASWGWLAALVLVTTVGGHGLTNLAARHVRLFLVNIVIVLEPAIAIGIGRLLFDAPIRPAVVVGGALLATAVIVALWPKRPGGRGRAAIAEGPPTVSP